MKFVLFRELFGKAVEKYELDKSFPEKAVFSVPVPVRRGERIYDAVFAYKIDFNQSPPVVTRPFCWFMLAGDGASECMFSWCSLVDFIPTENYPLAAVVSCEMPKPLPRKKFLRMQSELLDLYEELRQFAFKENIADQNADTIKKYRELFVKTCAEGLYPFYNALAPEFFIWLGLPLTQSKIVHIPRESSALQEYCSQSDILKSIEKISLQFEKKAADNSHNQKIIDNLHAELMEYKNDLVGNIILPLERDIMLLIDSCARSLKSFAEQPAGEENQKKLLNFLAGVKTDLADILYRQGIDPFEEPGDNINVSRQNIIKTQITQDPKLDKKLAYRIAPGWQKDLKVIRPEYICAYVYKEQ